MSRGVSAAIAGAVWLAAAWAQAETLKIMPSAFKRTGDAPGPGVGGMVLHYPGDISIPQGVMPSGCNVWAPVNLPVGKTISKIMYFHHASGNWWTQATLFRARFAQLPETLAYGASSQPYAQPMSITMNWSPSADQVIRPGYVYYVAISLSQGAGVTGVKVNYY
jgi:hypothetical protein